MRDQRKWEGRWGLNPHELTHSLMLFGPERLKRNIEASPSRLFVQHIALFPNDFLMKSFLR